MGKEEVKVQIKKKHPTDELSLHKVKNKNLRGPLSPQTNNINRVSAGSTSLTPQVYLHLSTANGDPLQAL